MKADNEPAISLPVYFKSVKTENMFFDKKKRKKKEKKQVSDGGSRTPDFHFSLEGERMNYTTSIIMWVHERRTTINLKYTRRKRHKKRINQAAICQLRMINLSKIRLFILESPWQLSMSWNRENNHLLLFLQLQQITNILPVVGNSASHYYSWATSLWSYDCGVPLFAEGYDETRKSSVNYNCYHGS